MPSRHRPFTSRTGYGRRNRREDGRLTKSASTKDETLSFQTISEDTFREFARRHGTSPEIGRIGTYLDADCKAKAPGNPRQGMLLICTGTGLAPLAAIARDALDAGHTGPVHLYHGSGSADGLYLQGALRELAARHSSFHYVPCVSREAAPAGCRSGRADDMALTDHADLTGWRIFLSGNAAMVHAAKRAVYLAGADLSHIHADPFEQRSR